MSEEPESVVPAPAPPDGRPADLARPAERSPSGPWWWGGLVVGGAIGLGGLVGLLRDAANTRPLVWAVWLLGALLAHDIVIAPAVHLIDAQVRRAPEHWRWPLQFGLVTSGVLLLASLPLLYGVGRTTQPGNTSVLPGNYPRALLVVLAVVWTVVVVLASVQRPRKPRRDVA